MDACRVAVVEHRDVLRVAFHEAYLFRCQRGATAGYHVLYANLVHSQHVEVAFHQDALVLFGDGALGKVDAIEGLLLVVDLRLGRVLVFRAFLVVGEDASTEANDASRQVMDGEHHTSMVAVVEPVVSFDGQADLLQQLIAVAILLGVLGEGIPFGWIVAQMELLYDGVEVAAFAEVFQTDGLALVCVPKRIDEVFVGKLVDVEHLLADALLHDFLRSLLAFLDFDVVFLG